jgi:hypothetical protein
MTRRTPADALLGQLPEYNVGLSLPDVISARLDGLVELANRAGARTSRKELIAALLLVARPRQDELEATVRRYRTTRARDALIRDGKVTTSLAFTPRQPGPRSRTTGTRTKDSAEMP